MIIRKDIAPGTGTACAFVDEALPDEDVEELTLADDVQAWVANGRLIGVEVSDTTRWGDEWSQEWTDEAALRAIAWAQSQLTPDVAG
jgi:hypothetical protein